MVRAPGVPRVPHVPGVLRVPRVPGVPRVLRVACVRPFQALRPERLARRHAVNGAGPGDETSRRRHPGPGGGHGRRQLWWQWVREEERLGLLWRDGRQEALRGGIAAPQRPGTRVGHDERTGPLAWAR